ncbi:ankyrin repeat domain-containing protein [Roseateles sp. NT4]|uniref:ankyrin repeat domain-containing protein n=1 Tax=Roseateles sp. NT4 TaxID=3453715 RepID=UPI003EE8BED9
MERDGINWLGIGLRAAALVVTISLLTWCSMARRSTQDVAGLGPELREAMMMGGMADASGMIDLDKTAARVGAVGMNRLLYDNAATGSLPALRWMVRHGAEPRNIGALDKGTLLQQAATKPTLDRMRLFIEEFKLDPTQQTPDRVGVMHLAARHGVDAQTMVFLTSRGLNINAADGSGRLPIHYAALKSIGPLVSAGADINALDSQGRTALHWAVEEGRHDAVAELIRLHASVFAQDNQGNTPLHLAAIGNSEPIVDTLLAAGAPKAARNTDGLTAREYLEKMRNKRRYGYGTDREQKL